MTILCNRNSKGAKERTYAAVGARQTDREKVFFHQQVRKSVFAQNLRGESNSGKNKIGTKLVRDSIENCTECLEKSSISGTIKVGEVLLIIFSFKIFLTTYRQVCLG